MPYTRPTCALGDVVNGLELCVEAGNRLRAAEQERDQYNERWVQCQALLHDAYSEIESLRSQLKAAQSDVWNKAADCLETSSSPKAAKFWIDGMVNLFRNRAISALVKSSEITSPTPSSPAQQS